MHLSARHQTRLIQFFPLVALISGPAQILGEGFRNPPPGAFSLGRAGGRIAHIDDASAVQQNPANMIDLDQPALSLAPSVVYIYVEHDSATGHHSETTNPWKFLPNFFFATPFQEGKFAAGIGLTTPYGLSNEWEKSGGFDPGGPLRYTAPWFTEMKTVNLNPSAALKISDTLSIGAGVDVMWSELTFKYFYPWGAIVAGSPDGNIKARADGVGLGVNAGITWEPLEGHRVALTYRSPIEVEYDGYFKIDNIPAGIAQERSDFSTDIDFPTIVAVGYGIELSPTIRVEVDVEWLEFSNFGALNLDIGANSFLFGTAAYVPQNWKNTFTAGIGGDWKFAPNWVFRTGYQFYESPVPDYTFSPTIPDANQHVFTTGIGYTHKQHTIEFAYGGIFYDERNITSNQNPAYLGTYSINVHLFAFRYEFVF
ncbi:MAG: outer membrane protein transport protein [Verrucomicrobiota bacterium]|nr:outer membrane protein transport protein [Verrucomicrobiota bacterium]